MREQQCVAVRRRFGGFVHADDATAAPVVVDHDRLAEIRRQRIGQHARHGIDGAAGGERHDQADRPGRITVRRCACDAEAQQRAKEQKPFHGSLPVIGMRYSAGIGVAGPVGASAAGVDGPFSTRSSMAIRNAMPKASTSAQLMNTKRNA